MAYNHFHLVYVFMNDGADFAQPFVGIKAKRKRLQAIDDVFTYLKDNIKASMVLFHICKDVAAAFYQQAGGQCDPVPQQHGASGHDGFQRFQNNVHHSNP